MEHQQLIVMKNQATFNLLDLVTPRANLQSSQESAEIRNIVLKN
jgi:hypothetical protein